LIVRRDIEDRRRTYAPFHLVGETGRMSTERAPVSVRARRRDAFYRSVQLLVGWGLIVAVLVGVGEALVGPLRGSVGVADNQAERWLAEHRSESLSDAATAASLLGETWTVIVFGPLLLVLTWVWIRSARAVAFMAAVIIGEIAAYLLTVSLVSRLRPPVPLLDPGLDPLHSYPSGHVAASAALYGGLAVLIWVFGSYRWRWLSLGLLTLPAIVAVARLYLGAHHPSDVLASLVFMCAWLAVVTAVALKDVRWQPGPSRVRQAR